MRLSVDPVVFDSVARVRLDAGWVGCALPPLRATRVDPQVALSAEPAAPAAPAVGAA